MAVKFGLLSIIALLLLLGLVSGFKTDESNHLIRRETIGTETTNARIGQGLDHSPEKLDILLGSNTMLSNGRKSEAPAPPAVAGQRLPAHPLVIGTWSAAYHGDFGPFHNGSVGADSSPKCAYTCHFIGKDHDQDAKADVIMVDAQDGDLPAFGKRPGQVWIANWWEAPAHSSYSKLQDENYMQHFDYTCSYRADSTIPIYSMMIDTTGANFSKVMDSATQSIHRSFQEKKQQSALMSAWVSNCQDEPSQRNELLLGLRNHGVHVASYGRCKHNHDVPPDLAGLSQGQQKISESAKYLFLYSAENALCPHYHTEKLYHAFVAGVVPVYLGASTVVDWAPKNSIIMADRFDSASQLAKYLQKVASDEDLYNSFFAWRSKPLPLVVQQKAAQQVDDTWRCNACRFFHVVHPHGTAHAENCQKLHVDPNVL